MTPEPMAIATERHEFVVIGAGLLGLATAWSLSRRGHEVTVLEAASVGHERSGSKGQARIFRLSYADPLYAGMAHVARSLWRDLEAESDRTLLHQTGQLNFGDGLSVLADTLSQMEVPTEHLSPDETAERFPELRIEGPSLFEPSSGVLAADACLDALRSTGSFAVREHSAVDHVRDDEDGVSIVLMDGSKLAARVVILCAGPNSSSLLGGMPPTASSPASLQQVVYLQPNSGQMTLPPFIHWGDHTTYGLPAIGRPWLKLSHHTTGPTITDVSAPYEDNPTLLDFLHDAAVHLLPGFDPVPVATERCPYDNTVDSDFVLDRRGHVVVGCGTSGHGFKFGPLLGKLLADLATGVEPSFDRRRFSLTRTVTRSGVNP